MVYYTRLFVLSLTFCYFVLVFFSPFSIAITSLGEERANLSAFRTFIRFVLVWYCLFPLSLGVWEGLWLVYFSLTFFSTCHAKVVPLLQFCFVRLLFHMRGLFSHCS